MARISMEVSWRESALAVIAGLFLVFAGWAWGGVVLWTQFVSCALGALALLVALMPQDPHSPYSSRLRRGLLISLAMGLMAAGGFGLIDWLELSKQRNATLQLIPDATLPDIAFADWGLRGAGVGVGLAVAGMFATLFGIPTSTRATLLRFPPFWIGVALFAYIAVQSLNPWGLVVERDLTWNIVPQDHIAWLPAGLAAPFIGDRDPGGMNGWRQMLILCGPWMLLCALHVAVMHRRTYARLAWIVGLNSLAIGVIGFFVSRGKDFSFLGFKNWYAYHAPFGPFIYRNHAGIYLYLSAALVLALTAYLITRRGDRADRGGPHLVAGLLFVMLCLASASTLSVGAVSAIVALLLLAPCVYFVDYRLRMALSPVPALILLGAALLLGYVGATSANLDGLRARIEKKQASLSAGSDDREPLRRALLAQVQAGSVGRLAFGWGGGSFRWTSPPYLAQQPEFVDAKGRLWARANYAHCDWLQALLEWGAVGCLIIGAGLAWLIAKMVNAWRRRSASLLALSAGIMVVLLHATLDFIFYFTPALALLALMITWLASAEDANAPHSGY